MSKYIPVDEPDAFIVIIDPDELGAFRPGAVILREHLREMIRPCMGSFTVGTILRDKQGNKYRVEWTEKGGQELIPV